MLRRRCSSLLLPGHCLRRGNGKIRCFCYGLDPPWNNQHDGGSLLKQPCLPASSTHCPGGNQSTLDVENSGRESFVRRCKSSRCDVRRPEWQDFELHRSTFGLLFPKLSYSNLQFRTNFPSGSGRHYGVPAYQDSHEPSACETSELEEPTNLRPKPMASNSGSVLTGNYHNGMVVAHRSRSRGLAKLREQDWGSPAQARVLSKLTSQKPTVFYVCRVLQEQEDPELAWQFFLWAGQQDGYYHTKQTYSLMLVTFCTAKKFKVIYQLLETMRRKGIPMSNEACSSIIKSLADDKKYGDAMRILETAKSYGCRASTLVYNCYLDVLVKAGHFDRLDVALAEMQAAGRFPNVYTYSILINGFGKAEQVERACRVYDEMKAQGCPPNFVTFDTLVRVLVKAGKTDEALQLLSDIIESGVGPPSVFADIICRTINDREGRICSGSDSFEQMKDGDCDPHHAISYHSLISLLCKKQHLDAALQMLREMEGRGCIPSISIYNLVLSSLGKAGEVDTVMKLFKHVREKRGCVPNKASYCTVISVLCRAGRNVEEAMVLHKEMVAQGLVSSTWLCNMLIELLAKSGQEDRAFEFFSQMQGCEPDAHTHNILMPTLCNAKNPQKILAWLKRVGIRSDFLTSRTGGGLNVLQRMKGVTGQDPIIYNTFIRTLCQAGRVDDAYTLLLDMRKNGVVLGPKSYGYVLELLGRSGQIKRAWKLFLRMGETNWNLINYSIMIKFLGRAGSFEKARKLLDEMKSRGVAPDALSYLALIRSLGQAGRLEEMYSLLEEMRADGCEPQTVTYNCLLDAFAKAGQVDRAYELFEESIDRGCIPNADSYNAILRGYFQSNRTEEALDLYDVMTGMGCVESEVTYNVLFAGLSKAGLSDMASKVLSEMSSLGYRTNAYFLNRLSAASLEKPDGKFRVCSV